MAPTIGKSLKQRLPTCGMLTWTLLSCLPGAHSHTWGTGACQRRGTTSILPAQTSLTSTGAGAGSWVLLRIRVRAPLQNIWGLFPSPGPRRACPTASLSRTQTLPGFARETGNFCPAASLGGFRHSAQWGTGRSQAAPGSASHGSAWGEWEGDFARPW